MKRLSFRLQVSFLSSALAGTALIVFGAISWWQIYRANLDRLDAQILNILMRGNGPTETATSELYQEQRWQLYSNSLADILGVNINVPTGLLVLDSLGNKIYQSESITKDPDLHQMLIHQLAIAKPPPPTPLLIKYRIGKSHRLRLRQLSSIQNLPIRVLGALER